MAERSTLSCRMRSESRHISYTVVAREIASPRDAPPDQRCGTVRAGLPPGSGLRSRTRGGATHSRSACQTGRPLVSGLERQEKEISMLPCLTEPKTYGLRE